MQMAPLPSRYKSLMAGAGPPTETITVTVSEVNTAPVLDAITPKGVARPDTLTFTATASDDDYREE